MALQVGGLDVYAIKSQWLDDDRLNSPLYREAVMEKLAHLIAHPDYPAYRLYAPLNSFRSIHIGGERLYARIYPAQKALVLLAYHTASKFKREEKSGALHVRFQDFLLMHDYFDDRTPRLLPLVEKSAREEDWATPQLPRPPRFRTRTITETEALALLASGNKRKFDTFMNLAIGAVYAQMGEKDKVLVPADTLDPDAIAKYRLTLPVEMKKLGLSWKCRYDDTAQKFLFFPPDKLKEYAPRRGRWNKI